MYIKRHLEEQVKSASKSYPVVMVCGQRQVGKSTMLYHIKESERKYVTLDDRNAKLLAEKDPALFLENYGTPLLIDEIQRAPGLLLEIKRFVDERALKGEDCGGRFWLTGSQRFRMMKGVSETLSGRIAVFEMAGLSAREIDGREARLFSPDIKDLKVSAKSAPPANVTETFKNILIGSMPKLISEHVDRERYYQNYVNTYLERDIRDLAQVGNLDRFYEFLVYMAARTAQQLNFNDIAKNIGVSAPTAKNWVSILENSGVLYLLRPYSGNITKRLTKSPKAYFTDTGLAAYLCRWPDHRTLEEGPMNGAFFETYVVAEILKSFYNAGIEPNMYYYRDSDKNEIDLIFVQGDRLYPAEIKKAKSPENADKSFRQLKGAKGRVMPGLVICSADQLAPYSRDAWICPLTLI